MAKDKEGRAAELRGKSDEELGVALSQCGEELMNLRFKKSVGSLEKPARLGELRRKRARILTILRERREAR